MIRDPTEDQIATALRELSEAAWYVILELRPDNFIQAGMGSEAGVPDGAYAVEFRAGGRDSHMGAHARSRGRGQCVPRVPQRGNRLAESFPMVSRCLLTPPRFTVVRVSTTRC